MKDDYEFKKHCAVCGEDIGNVGHCRGGRSFAKTLDIATIAKKIHENSLV